MAFRDRAEAGLQLAAKLADLRGEEVVVVGLPGGGVPVAFEVARVLGAPLDVVVVRKLGVPFQPELAMGAVGEGGVRIVNHEVVRAAGVTEAELDAAEWYERAELERRARRYRSGRPPVSLRGRTVVVVDDGIATGSTAEAACQVVKALGASRVVLAVPVIPRSAIAMLRAHADEVVSLEKRRMFWAVGQFYKNFSPVTDEEVINLLDSAAHRVLPVSIAGRTGSSPEVAIAREEEIEVDSGEFHLAGHLIVPEGARAAIIFACGSGSSHHSPRNRFVAGLLNGAGFATLLFDLLSVDEELDRSNVFDVELLADRLRQITSWFRGQRDAAHLPIGYLGVSTAAAAALYVAADPDSHVFAVVSRGGRPELAASKLGQVRSPTLLIVGVLDDAVLALNRQAQALLRCESELAVIKGATNLFEEPENLEEATSLARRWFERHLVSETKLTA